jgi:uncharacterized protein (UPF0147 family)
MKAIEILKELYYDPTVPVSVRKKIRKAIIEVMREEGDRNEAMIVIKAEMAKMYNDSIDRLLKKEPVTSTDSKQQ